MERVLANLSLLARERQGLQCAGHVLACEDGCFLMPIANMFNLGSIDSTEARSIFLAEIEPIYGWLGLRKKELKFDMFTTARLNVATTAALNVGVKILRVIELQCNDDVGVPSLSLLVLFEASSQAWPDLASWRYAFAMTAVCGIRAGVDEVLVAHESRWRLSLSKDRQILELTSKEGAGAKVAEGGIETRGVSVKLAEQETIAEVIPDVVRVKTRFTSLSFNESNILHDPQARVRVDKSYAFETVRHARILANSNDALVSVEASSFPTPSTDTSSTVLALRAVPELVCSDMFRAQIVLDSRHPDNFRPRESAKAGSARGTLIFVQWLDGLLDRCDLDSDCVDALVEALLPSERVVVKLNRP